MWRTAREGEKEVGGGQEIATCWLHVERQVHASPHGAAPRLDNGSRAWIVCGGFPVIS